MKAKEFLFPVLIIIVIALTGATINNNGFVKPPKGYVFIPMGTAEIGNKIRTFQAYYISETEVTNSQYGEFLTALKTQGKTQEYELAKIDSARWTQYVPYGTSYYDKTYHLKKDYPVVNISKEGAKLYCKWLSEKYSVNKEGVQYEFRLPTNAEWEYAARGGLKKCPYPWGGPYPYNSSGNFLAQFLAFGLNYGPVPVKTYPANDFGVYDMSGNVAEMVGDTTVVRGGSWDSSDYGIQIPTCGEYYVSPTVGFRPVMTFLEKKQK